MSEGAGEPENIRLDSITIEPNGCPLTAPLTIEVQFEALDHFPNAYWEITVRASAALPARARAPATAADSPVCVPAPPLPAVHRRPVE